MPKIKRVFFETIIEQKDSKKFTKKSYLQAICNMIKAAEKLGFKVNLRYLQTYEN